jgi:hypothetical protein
VRRLTTRGVTQNEPVDLASQRSTGTFSSEARAWNVSPRTALVLFTLPFSGLLLVGLDLIHGDLGLRLLAEDSAVEWLTALTILSTSGLAGVMATILWRGGHRVQALAYGLLCVASVVAAGEEISWGQRLFGVETPESVREANQQGELNIHNLDVVYEPYVAAMLLVGLYGSVGSWFVYRFKQWRTPNWYLFMPPVFLAGAFLQLAVYRILRYLGASGHNYGEWCELCVTVAIAIFVALNIRRLSPDRVPLVRLAPRA